jgi:hypothetical protein
MMKRKTKDEYSSQTVVRRCDVGLCCVRVIRAGAGPDAQECSAKYQAAKTAGTLGGQKRERLRGKAQRGADATPAAAPAALLRRARTGCEGSQEGSRAGSRPRCRPDCGLSECRVDPKYAKESPGKARMHTVSISTTPRAATAMAA